MSGTFDVIDYHRPLAPIHSVARAAATAACVLTAARECPCCRPWLEFGIVDQALRNLCWCAGWLQRIDVNAERWLWTRRIMRPVRCRDRCGCCRRADDCRSALCGKAPSAFVGFADGVTIQRAGLLANEPIIPQRGTPHSLTFWIVVVGHRRYHNSTQNGDVLRDFGSDPPRRRSLPANFVGASPRRRTEEYPAPRVRCGRRPALSGPPRLRSPVGRILYLGIPHRGGD